MLCVLFATTAAAAPRRWIIVMPWQPQAQFAGIYYAKESGIFEKLGLDVEIRHKAPGTPIVESLTSGSAQFIVAPLAAMLVERSKGVPLVNICQINQTGNILLVAARRSGIAQPADLKQPGPDGKPLRFSVWDSDAGTLPLLFLRQQGIDGVSPSPGSGVEPFLWGAVDVISAMEYNEYYQLLAAGYDPEELTVFRLRDHQLNIPEDGVYALEKTVAGSPAVCVALRAAVLEGWSEALRNPERALKFVRLYTEREGVRFDPAQQLWMFNVFGRSLGLDTPQAGTLAPEVFDSVIRIFRRNKLIVGDADFRTFCPNTAKPAGGKK
jgi:NitT/TauT family transport system substrate-binding protein